MGTIDQETSINIRAICNCYPTAQIKLFVVEKFPLWFKCEACRGFAV